MSDDFGVDDLEKAVTGLDMGSLLNRFKSSSRSNSFTSITDNNSNSDDSFGDEEEEEQEQQTGQQYNPAEGKTPLKHMNISSIMSNYSNGNNNSSTSQIFSPGQLDLLQQKLQNMNHPGERQDDLYSDGSMFGEEDDSLSELSSIDDLDVSDEEGREL